MSGLLTTHGSSRFRKAIWIALLSSLCLPSISIARTIDNIDNILRETRIVADVINSALRNEMKDGVRVSNVTAQYLAKQGVLVAVRLNAPWLTINDSDTSININTQINLEEIPTMVENILNDLEIEVSPFEPEALEALRSLRTEQRELREEQRHIRAKLRENRRRMVRAKEDDEREEVKEEIKDLERELAAVGAQYDALAKDIDRQYQELRDYRGGHREPPQPKVNKEDYDEMIAQVACDYGSTLKSLSSENYLTIALHRDTTTNYYAFKMDHIYSCGRNDMRAERLLELAYRYGG